MLCVCNNVSDKDTSCYYLIGTKCGRCLPEKRSEVKGFKYSPQTGLIYRVTNSYQHPQHVGPVSRKPMKDGYLQCSVNNVKYRQHQLAFLILGITIPKNKVIDHINGNKIDNRLCNLRIVSPQKNSLNQARHREGKMRGVMWHSVHKKWLARITVNKKRIYLGYFKTEQEATKARLDAERKYYGS